MNAGVALAKRADDRREELFGNAFDACNRNRTASQSLQGVEFGNRTFEIGIGAPDMCQQQLSGLRQTQAPADTVKQLQSERLFQPENLPVYGR